MPDAQYIHGTAPEEQARLATLNRITNASFLAFLGLRGSESVLEVGSGLGLLAAEVAEAIPRGRVVGVEYSAAQLARAPAGIANLTFRQGDAHQLEFDPGTFDVVYCRYLLEHVANPVQVLREVRRVLKPGGRLYVQENDISLVRNDPPTPAFDRVWEAFAELQSRLGGDALIGRRLFRLGREAGFRNDLTLSVAPEVYWHGHPVFAPWLENLVGNIRSGQAKLVEMGLSTEAEIAAAIGELQTTISDSQASTWFYWNRASATKERSQ